jgi:nucleoside-diphosphate-sugar epimerase
MHVLVTGASSFLGRHIAMHLVRAGHQVTGTYRNDHPCLAPLRAAQVALAPLDLADAESYGVLPSSIDAVVHVAGVSITPGISLDGHARL